MIETLGSPLLSRPSPLDVDRYPEAEWTFSVRTTEKLPHGHAMFGGILRQQGRGWQAKTWTAQTWGPTKHSRRAAISAALPEAIRALAAAQATLAAKDRTAQRLTAVSDARQKANDSVPALIDALVACASLIDPTASEAARSARRRAKAVLKSLGKWPFVD